MTLYRVIKGYGPEDFSRVDLEAQLGKGNTKPRQVYRVRSVLNDTI